MIIDSLANASQYRALHPHLGDALDFLTNNDLAALSAGKHPIRNEDVFAIVNDYDTRPESEGTWEAHRQYIDVQVVARGRERMGYAPIEDLSVTTPYDAEKDSALLEGPGNWVTVNAGMFTIFLPQDAHIPGIAVAQPEAVRKIVVKVRTGEGA